MEITDKLLIMGFIFIGLQMLMIITNQRVYSTIFSIGAICVFVASIIYRVKSERC